ncbi:MAG TPA: PAS domain S-box protein [Leptospiraceae bacterium]|nr:PAS domain S-box protein [Leptospiraceae bacterium]
MDELIQKIEDRSFRALIENASDGIAMVVFSGTDGTMSYVSPSTHRILGYTPEEMLGKNPGIWTHPDDLNIIGPPMLELLENPGRTIQMQYRMRHKNGEYIWIESNVGNFLDHSILNALIFNFRDITERKADEETLKTAKEAAEKANRAKTEFLSGMSHELRTPLNAIIGFTDLIRAGGLSEDQRVLSEYVLNSANHLLKLIDNLMNFPGIEAGSADSDSSFKKQEVQSVPEKNVQSPQKSSYEKMRGCVLYVEDNVLNSALMNRIFQRNLPNVELVISKDAEEGLETADRIHPDLILMDIHLPGMNGFQAASSLKAAETTSDIPVIAVSADATPTALKNAEESGIIAYITKPYNAQDLLRKVTVFLKTAV